MSLNKFVLITALVQTDILFVQQDFGIFFHEMGGFGFRKCLGVGAIAACLFLVGLGQ